MRYVSLLIQVTAIPQGGVETKHQKEAFLVLREVTSPQDRVLLVMTGTDAKRRSLEEIVRPDGVFVPGIIRLIQFAEAGKAPEPVTTSCLHLMLGKADGQDKILQERLNSDSKLRESLSQGTIIIARNDVNHSIAEVPITKSKLQKEHPLFMDEYQRLIAASMKFLAMKSVGMLPPGLKWDQVQSDWKQIDRCLKIPFNERVFLPIDYQVIDSYQEKRIVDRRYKNPRYVLESLSPTVSVERRAYARIELDYTQGDGLVNTIVHEYLTDNWNNPDFTPSRYQLGIQHKRFLSTFLSHGQHVLFDDRATPNVLYLRGEGRDERESTLQRIEDMLNGFSEPEYQLALSELSNRKHSIDTTVNIVQKPGAIIYQKVRMSSPLMS